MEGVGLRSARIGRLCLLWRAWLLAGRCWVMACSTVRTSAAEGAETATGRRVVSGLLPEVGVVALPA